MRSNRLRKLAVNGLGAILFSAVGVSANAMVVERNSSFLAGTVTHVNMEVEVGTGASPQLDILFVVDDSGSMSQHQANLLANAKNLVKAALASGIDLHAGVISTTADGSSPRTPGKGELIGVAKKFADSNTGDFEKILFENLTMAMTTDGAAIEQPFLATKLALSEPMKSTVNAGFLRPGAALSVFLLTDADDQSPGTPAEFAKFLRDTKPTAPAALYAAYIPSADKTCNRSGEQEPQRIEAVLKEFNTEKDSIGLCETDYSKKLAKIGDAITTLGLRVVQLQLPPDVATFKITYGKTVLLADPNFGWTYDAAKNQLLFGDKIDWSSEPVGTKLLINYTEL